MSGYKTSDMTSAKEETRTAIIDVIALSGNITGPFARRLALYLRELDQGRDPATVAMGVAMEFHRQMDETWMTSHIGLHIDMTPQTKGQAQRREGVIKAWEALASIASVSAKYRTDLDKARSDRTANQRWWEIHSFAFDGEDFIP